MAAIDEEVPTGHERSIAASEEGDGVCDLCWRSDRPERMNQFDVFSVGLCGFLVCQGNFNLPRIPSGPSSTVTPRAMSLIPAFTALYGKIPGIVENA